MNEFLKWDLKLFGKDFENLSADTLKDNKK